MSNNEKAHLILMLEQMISSYENFPTEALHAPVTHYDLCSSLQLLLEIFKADCD